jgi:MSHA biogenesis protein MshJ
VDEAQGFIDRATERAPLARVIRSMVAAEPGLTLTNLKTLPVDVFFRPGAAVPGGKADAQASSTPTLYRHGIEATVKGSYAALLPYLQGLQKHSDRLFWTQVSLEVAHYPDATLKLTIYTLSDQQEAPLV